MTGARGRAVTTSSMIGQTSTVVSTLAVLIGRATASVGMQRSSTRHSPHHARKHHPSSLNNSYRQAVRTPTQAKR